MFIPTYPQNIFSVKAATERGASVIFKNEKDVLIFGDTRFDIHVYGELYYLHTGSKSIDKCHVVTFRHGMRY